MTAPGTPPISPEEPFPFQLLAQFAQTDEGAQREAEYEPCMAAYGKAVVAGQLLEFVIKLAGPSITATVDDEDQAHAEVKRGRGRNFDQAIKHLGDLLPRSDRLVDADLTERLHAARLRRNELAHEWVFDGPLRIARGEGEAVRDELNCDAKVFAGLTEELFASLLTPALALRGLSPLDLTTAADIVGLYLAKDPTLPVGDLPDDGFQVLTDVLAALEDVEPSDE